MSEHSEQVAVIQWCKYKATLAPEFELVFAIPNGAKLPYFRNRAGKRVSSQAIKLINEGLKAGVSDLYAAFARGVYHGAFIELKHAKNKPTAEQINFLQSVSLQGYLAVVCWECEAAIAVLETYYSLSKDGVIKQGEIDNVIVY